MNGYANAAPAAALGGQQSIYGYGLPQPPNPQLLTQQQQQQLQQLRQQQYARALLAQQQQAQNSNASTMGNGWGVPQSTGGSLISPILRALQGQNNVAQQWFGNPQPQQAYGGNQTLGGGWGANAYSGWPPQGS